MRLSFGMETRQLQTQKLAPKMIQSMEILQLPVLALQERVEQEMNENPMLEVDEEENPSEPDQEEEDPNRPTESETELVVKDDQSNEEDFERLANMDNDLPETFDDFRTSSNRTQEAQDRQHDLMANAPGASRVPQRLPATSIGRNGNRHACGGNSRANHFHLGCA
jgi:RNA polymerase sigma-54 factor